MEVTQNGNSLINRRTNLKDTKVDGFKSWLTVMVLIFIAHMLFNNYLKFGIQKGPDEIFFSSVLFILQYWKLYCLTLACHFQHILHVYLIEISIAKNFTSEKIGMVLHACNVFFLPTVFTILARYTNAQPMISRLIATYIMYVMTKSWSFAFVNSQMRKLKRQNENKRKDNGSKATSLVYPKNVTMQGLVSYFIFSPPMQYQPHLSSKLTLNWAVLFKFMAKQFLVVYGTVFISVQLLYPDFKVLRGERDWKLIVNTAFIVSLPTNAMWLLFCYVSTYKVYLPSYAEFAGMKNLIFSEDWWNSKDINMFWRKWNIPVHECLKYNVVIPLLKNGYSKMFCNLVAFTLAGLLHEYINSLPMGIYNGFNLLLTLLEIPLGNLSEYISNRYGPQYGNLFFWAYLIILHTFGLVAYTIGIPQYEAMKL